MESLPQERIIDIVVEAEEKFCCGSRFQEAGLQCGEETISWGNGDEMVR